MRNGTVITRTQTPARGRRSSAGGLASTRQVYGYLFVLPALAVLGVLVVYPLLYGFYISFFTTNLVSKWKFVGFAHYIDALTSAEFQADLWVTLQFTFFVVLGHLVIGLLLAVLLARKVRGRTLFRVVLLLPWLFPESVIALLFKWIFNPLYGILNWFLISLDVIREPVSWLGTGDFALPAVIFVCIWKGYPMIMMIMLSGLQTIPDDLYEAASIDGASAWQTFWRITLPSLRPVLVVALVLDTVWWFKHYTLVYVLTGGGPGNATSIVSISIYREAFDNFNFGSAAAMSVIVFAICLLLAMVYRKALDRD